MRNREKGRRSERSDDCRLLRNRFSLLNGPQSMFAGLPGEFFSSLLIAADARGGRGSVCLRRYGVEYCRTLMFAL
jgi:hypothetical protein